MIKCSNVLEGFMVGIGVRRANGELDYKWLEKPVHNTIVSSGYDHILRYNGTDDFFANSDLPLTPMFYRGSGYSNHYGIFSYMAIGSGESPTTIGMTSLENPISSSTGLIYSHSPVTGEPYCGQFVEDVGKYRYRITHQSVAVSALTTVSEFGLFGATGPSVSYKMFSRVVIPQELRPVLQAGESAVITYELRWYDAYSGSTPTDIGNIGFLDSDGNNSGLCAEARHRTIIISSTGWNQESRWLGLTTNGVDSTSTGSGFSYESGTALENVVWRINYGGSQVTHPDGFKDACCCHYWTSSKDFPTSLTSHDGGSFPTINGPIKGEYKVDPYVVGSAKRTYHIKIHNTSASPLNIWYMRVKGTDYKFYKMTNGEKTYTPLVIEALQSIQLDFIMEFSE